MYYRKQKKTRGKTLRKLVQWVTNTEKETEDGIFDKGETLKQILEDSETEDLSTVPPEQKT